jgi:hypothetical protein
VGSSFWPKEKSKSMEIHRRGTPQNHQNTHDNAPALDERWRDEYLQMISNLSLNFCIDHFHFTYSRNQNLTHEEFIELCELYEIPRARVNGSKGLTITLHTYGPGSNSIDKRIFFFIRDQNQKYNVLIAEAKQVSGPNWSAMAISGGIIAGASTIVLLCVSAPAIVTGVAAVTISGVVVGGKYLYDRNSHHQQQQYQDPIIGHMIHQLETEKVIEFCDSRCYLRCGDQLIDMEANS